MFFTAFQEVYPPRTQQQQDVLIQGVLAVVLTWSSTLSGHSEISICNSSASEMGFCCDWLGLDSSTCLLVVEFVQIKLKINVIATWSV